MSTWVLMWMMISIGYGSIQKGVSPAHNGQVCSTWGNYHFKSFDGDVFQLPSTCNYILTSHCKSTYEDFNIQLRRQVVDKLPAISKITLKLDGTVVEFSKDSIIVNGETVLLPFSQSGVLIEKSSSYIKVTAKLGLVAMWNEEDAFLVELDEKYRNQTCGLCGDFNGVQLYNEFIQNAKKCPFNMEHQECGIPCADTCSNPERGQLCEDHCTDGCFCPPDTVFDDITQSGCIPVQKCSCSHNGQTYTPGESYSSSCSRCTCVGGQWSCQDLDCPRTCSVQGGSHITTFDGKPFTFHGDCSYVLAKQCNDSQFTVLGEIVKCGLTDTETCLKAVTLAISAGQTVISIKPCGSVFVNGIFSQLPLSTADVVIFRPSTFYIIVQASLGLQLQVQLTPVMQVYITVSSSNKGQTCGLCGNFNDVQGDDFKINSGIVEGTAVAFANTWKTTANCPDVTTSYENPCSLSVENEKYAQHWCSMLSDPQGVFAVCHAVISPDIYKTNCMYDSCNCEKSEDCLCAAISSYVRACAAKGVQLDGWRASVCTKYSSTCPRTLVFGYSMTSCNRTCRSLSQPDPTCSIQIVPVDGCGCAKGTYMNEEGKCVPASQCPCYNKGTVVPAGEVIRKDGAICTCKQGELNCIGRPEPNPTCKEPMIFFDCTKAGAGAKGSECQKSCQTLDMDCISTECTSGCMCPQGLVSDGKGGCVKEDLCPCMHNGASYQPGDKIRVDCNTCTCKDRRWQCTSNQCQGTYM
ncbi:MUC5A protein, partial [Atractosteus spatula]|nr:MUC5A protein [Atractosteus spatula]